MTRRYFLALAAIPVLLTFLRRPSDLEFAWWTTNALEKVHPYDGEPVNSPHVVKIQAARNEFEPFQVVFRAASQDIDAVDVDVTDLRGPSGVIPSKANVTVYLENYLNLRMPSAIDGGSGEWPDPLIPRIDRYAREKRNAFPFRLTKGRNQPIWVDVYVPQHTAPGLYHGTLQMTFSGRPRLGIPIDLQVWNFDLPSTSSLITTFGFSGLQAIRQHFGKYTTDKGVADLTSVYQKAGLWHRLTMDGSSGTPPKLSGTDPKVHIQWDEYDAQIAPFLEGRAFSQGEPLYGAKITAVTLHPPPALKGNEQLQIQYWRDVANHFRQKGWMDRLFIYLWDEPKPAEYAAVIELGRTIRRADGTLKTLVTTPLKQDWSDFVDIWTPTINCLERKPAYPDYCQPAVERPGYEPELAKGKSLWWYQACNTHGCNVVGGDYFTGWPSYMIDHVGVRNRIMEWLTWKYKIGGELYFNTDEAYNRSKDPWKDIYLFGGNGDGTLFYPGRPDIIGGTTNIPIESIRLKLIREGLEDYEYLTLLSKLGGSRTATEAVNSFIRRTYDFDTQPEKLYAVRQSLANEITRRMGTTVPSE